MRASRWFVYVALGIMLSAFVSDKVRASQRFGESQDFINATVLTRQDDFERRMARLENMQEAAMGALAANILAHLWQIISIRRRN